MTDPRLHSPAAARNREPILEVLRRELPRTGLVLEIASGSGEHVVHFARALPQLTFQPSDPDAAARASIAAWCAESGLANLRAALALDVAAEAWPVSAAAAVLCLNMIHISPWASTIGLMRGAARILAPGSLLYLYGPFFRAEEPTAPSNIAFDEDLRRRNPAWGVRDLAAVAAEAAVQGLALARIEPMPANNLSVLFRR
jgi:SAM-dependent methyltransferase